MDFLDKLVLPQSKEHIELLHYMLILILFLFIPFMSIIFGGSALSIYFKVRGKNESNNNYLRFSKDIIELVTINKSVGIVLGIVPVIASILIIAQLLHTSGSASVSYLIFSAVLITVGLILIYTYRYSLSFTDIFNSIRDFKTTDQNLNKEIVKFREGNSSLNSKAGRYGILFLFIGIWLFINAVTLITYPDKWGKENIIYNLFSWQVLLRFLQFIAASLALTGGTILFANFFWEGGRKDLDDDYKEFVRKSSINITFAAALIQPVLLFINLIALPSQALSTGVFTYSVIALLLIFVAYHFLYAMIKNSSIKFSGHIFYFLLFALLALIVKDQLAMSNATKVQSAKLSNAFDVYLADLKGETGVVEVSGQEIFEVRCASCHRFDTKLVGPPYTETLPKYEGKAEQLVSFILNPVKVNPQYPPMPDPGLKPNEAKAVAQYIMDTYKK
jgi:cytochrome c